MLKKFSLFFILLTIFITSVNAFEVKIGKMGYVNRAIISLQFDVVNHLGEKKDNWIGIYKPGTSNEWKNVIAWAWIKDLRNGIAPGDDSQRNRYYFYDLAEGSYELRLFENNSFETSASFAFETSEALDNPKLEIVKQTEVAITFHATYIENSWIGIYKRGNFRNDWQYVEAWSWVKDSEVTINLEDLPRGDYRARLFYRNSFKDEKRVSFSHNGIGKEPFVTVDDFNGFSTMRLSSSFQVGESKSWIGLYKKNDSNAIENRVVWKWVDSTESHLQFSNLEVGVYELRLFYDGFDEPVAKTEVNVDGKQVFRLDKNHYGQHQIYDMYQDITYFAPMNGNDWVGLFKQGAERKRENLISWGRPFDYGYTNRVVFKTPGKVGKYDLVYFINDSYEQFGKSMELEFR